MLVKQSCAECDAYIPVSETNPDSKVVALRGLVFQVRPSDVTMLASG